jgi:hypothetical protein
MPEPPDPPLRPDTWRVASAAETNPAVDELCHILARIVLRLSATAADAADIQQEGEQ